jgi:hypothetical protein
VAALARAFVRKRKYFAAKFLVTSLAGRSIKATTLVLHCFSLRDDVHERANYARFG